MEKLQKQLSTTKQDVAIGPKASYSEDMPRRTWSPCACG